MEKTIADRMTELEEQEFDFRPMHKGSYIRVVENIRPGRALITSKPTIELLGLDYPNVHKNGNIVPLLHNQEIESKV